MAVSVPYALKAFFPSRSTSSPILCLQGQLLPRQGQLFFLEAIPRDFDHPIRVNFFPETMTSGSTFFLEAIPRDFDHTVRVNFFAPWVACLFLLLGLPLSIPVDRKSDGIIVVWHALMAPILCLELKIYGQWMFSGRRRLSMVANPSNHLSIVRNFSVGLAHYAVLLVTLYQRLPTTETLPKELHPVFFLFAAVPTVAGMAWTKIHDSFDCVSRIPYFLGLFLNASLASQLRSLP